MNQTGQHFTEWERVKTTKSVSTREKKLKNKQDHGMKYLGPDWGLRVFIMEREFQIELS